MDKDSREGAAETPANRAATDGSQGPAAPRPPRLRDPTQEQPEAVPPPDMPDPMEAMTATAGTDGDGAAQGRVQEVVARLDSLSDRDRVELSEIVRAFGETAFIPVLMVLGLVVLSPLSGIPLLPTIFGSMIALIALQLLVGRKRIWLPGVLMRRKVSGRALHRGLGRLKGFSDWLDRTARDRLTALVSPPLDAVVKLACILSGAAMPFLELVPFSSSILGAAVILFGTGLLTRDGLFALIGAGLIALAALVPLTIYGGLLRAAFAG